MVAVQYQLSEKGRVIMKHEWTKLPKWAQKDLKFLTDRVAKLSQDVKDMQDSVQTVFVRCSKCQRLHDRGYVCPHCGYHKD